MNLFWFETRKIWSKKIVFIGLILAFAWFFLYFTITTQYYTCVDNGTLLKGKAATLKNQEIAAEYTGPMTMEKAQGIIDQYGYSVYINDENEGYYRDGNYCNQWVTDQMTPYTETYEYTADELYFYSGEDTTKFEKFLDSNLSFSYQEGWADLISMLQMMTGMLNFIIIIAIANVFTEEYSLHTAPILLTSTHGKSKGIWMKVLSSVVFSLTCCLVMISVMVLSYISFYGTAGLEGSAIFSNLLDSGAVNLFGTTIGGVLAETILLCFVSVFTSTCITLAVSAACKLPFTTILISLGLFIFPTVYIKLIVPFFPETNLLNLTKAAVNRLPIYLPESKLGSNAIAATIFILAVCVLTIFLGYRKYKSYQETS